MAKIKLNLMLIKIYGKKEIEIYFEGTKKLTEAINEIGLSQADIGMVIKNGKWAPVDCIVKKNDVIQLFPHLEGG